MARKDEKTFEDAAAEVAALAERLGTPTFKVEPMRWSASGEGFSMLHYVGVEGHPDVRLARAALRGYCHRQLIQEIGPREYEFTLES